MPDGLRYTTRVTVYCVASIVFCSFMGCTSPGAIAPSTIPIPSGVYTPLSKMEEASSCGYTLLSVPLKNPQPVPALIEELIKSRGGKALVDVTSNSSMIFYGVGVANCVNIKGMVVNFKE